MKELQKKNKNNDKVTSGNSHLIERKKILYLTYDYVILFKVCILTNEINYVILCCGSM